MKYNPDKHHRRSIRLQGYDYTSAGVYFITICTHQRQCLFGAVVDGEMQLNEYGQIVRSYWLKLPNHHAHLHLDKFVIMPNHVHGILVLTDNPVGAGFDIKLTDQTNQSLAKPALTTGFDVKLTGQTNQSLAKPAPTTGFDVKLTGQTNQSLAKPAPTNALAHTKRHGIPEIIRGFKTFSARCINQHRKMVGVPVWQRNYYEHIVRNEASLQRLRQYIHNNPLSWQEDQLHPEVPSKW